MIEISPESYSGLEFSSLTAGTPAAKPKGKPFTIPDSNDGTMVYVFIFGGPQFRPGHGRKSFLFLLCVERLSCDLGSLLTLELIQDYAK